MKTKARNQATRRGAALLTTIIIVMSMSALVATMASVGIQRAFMARKLAEQVRAQAIAEAGANEAFNQLASDFDLRESDETFPETAYGDGTYDVTVTAVGDSIAVIRSDGTYRSATSVAILDAAMYGGGASIDWPAWIADYGIICGGTFDFRGCGDVDAAGTNGGLIHANGAIDIRGDAGTSVSISSSTSISVGNNDIDGDIAAPELILHNHATVSGTASEESVPQLEIPQVDLTPYYNWANDNGEVYNGLNVSGGTLNPVGGIIWVNGDVHISSHTVVNGTIIATGDISFGGQADITPSSVGFSLVSRDGDISITSSGTMEGIIYLPVGDLSYSANGDIEGQMVVNGNIRNTGCSDALLFTEVIATPPGEIEGDPEYLGLSAWQR